MWVVVVGADRAWHGAAGAGATADSPQFGWIVEVWIDLYHAGRTLSGRAPPGLNDRLRRTTLRKKPNKTLTDRRARYVAASASADQSRRGGNGLQTPLTALSRRSFPLSRRRAAGGTKAVNTTDSNGEQTEKYRAISMVSARMDDVANYLPAD